MTVIASPRLDLIPMSPELIDALVGGDVAAVEALAGGIDMSGFLPLGRDLVELFVMRRDQVRADPSWAPWSLRAIVLRDSGVAVGHANFHGPPGINDTSKPGAAEVGYEVFPSYRNTGIATEVARAMIRWARKEHGVKLFVSAVAPDNLPSLRVNEKLGFKRTGEIVDGEVIFEMRVE